VQSANRESRRLHSQFARAARPSNEQKRIVSKIDELFSSIEDGERALERVRKLVERYRQSVLKAAVTGELTRAWRDRHAGELEFGEALLTRIIEARRKAWEKSELGKMKQRASDPLVATGRRSTKLLCRSTNLNSQMLQKDGFGLPSITFLSASTSQEYQSIRPFALNGTVCALLRSKRPGRNYR